METVQQVAGCHICLPLRETLTVGVGSLVLCFGQTDVVSINEQFVSSVFSSAGVLSRAEYMSFGSTDMYIHDSCLSEYLYDAILHLI